MLSRVKLALITLGICCIFLLIFVQQLTIIQRVIYPSSNEVTSSNLDRKINESAENKFSNPNALQNTPPTACPAIEATSIPHSSNIKSKSLSNNRSFSEHNLWYEERLTKNTLALSHYDIKTTKKILVWTNNWNDLPNPLCDDRKDWFRNYGCPVWQCEVIPYDRERKNLNASGIPVEDFDAVVFYDPFWGSQFGLPTKRSPHQRYVFWNLEAPQISSFPKWEQNSDYFNWSMTYRWDSDIVVPYGYTRYLTGEEIRSRKEGNIQKNYAEGKTKMAVWLVSNCPVTTGRNEYVQKLKNYIPVDIYGRCGNLTCERSKQRECREMMGRDYKFYIAFENMICYDYVTEKMFYNPQFNIIPIVFDLHGNYDRFVPPKSFINALDFPTVKELADYLKVLDKNDTLYNEYFRWKESYAFEYSLHLNELNIYEKSARGYCDLCAKLHDPSEPVSTVKNLKNWFGDDASCKVITFPPDSVADNDKWVAKSTSS